MKKNISRSSSIETTSKASSATILLSGVPSILPASVKSYWNPETEQFKNDDEANAMISRSQREIYVVKYE